MFRFFRAFIGWFKGLFGSAADSLQENQHVMSATYDAAIEKQRTRFTQVKKAVAELITLEQDRVSQVKELGEKLDRLHKIQSGAQAAMQKRIDALRNEGKPKEEILKDADFIKHKSAYEDATRQVNDTQATFDSKEADLKDKRAKIAKYKGELQGMQRNNEKLREEKQEALADVGLAKQEEAINATLAGIPEDSADKDLVAARAARKRVVNRAHITSELAGNDAKTAENEYLQMAETAQANTQLDSLLNWGDEPKKEEPLAPAKLPE